VQNSSENAVPRELGDPVAGHDPRFFVEVGAMSHNRNAEPAVADRVLELTVSSHDASRSGSMGLDGAWELPGVEDNGAGKAA
jgi:hypothetical protein